MDRSPSIIVNDLTFGISNLWVKFSVSKLDMSISEVSEGARPIAEELSIEVYSGMDQVVLSGELR